MADQKTVVLIKPDAYKKGQTEEIKQRYTDAGLRVVSEGKVTFLAEDAREFYAEHLGKFFFEGTILFMTSGPMHAMILEGPDAIAKARALNGPTDPKEAEEGTIRRDFRSAGGPANTVHASADEEAAEREIVFISSYALMERVA